MTTNDRPLPEPSGLARCGWYALAKDSGAGMALLPRGQAWQIGGSEALFATLPEAAAEAKRRLGRGARLVCRGVPFEDAT